MPAPLDITFSDSALTPAYLKLLAADAAPKGLPQPVACHFKSSMATCIMALPPKRFRAPIVPALALGEMMEETEEEELGPLPPKLVYLRAEAGRLEANCMEASTANCTLFSENNALRDELDRLLGMGSPSDTPLGTQR